MSAPWFRMLHGRWEDLSAEVGDFSHVVSDPPYGIGYVGSPGETAPLGIYAGKRQRRTRERVIGDDFPFDPSPWLKWPCAFWGAQHFYHRLPAGGSLHSWDKRGDYKAISFGDADFVWVSQPQVARTFRLVWRGLCRHAQNFDRSNHPTEKPVSLMQWVLELLRVPVGATVYDPYAGSASTGVACLLTGRNFIGTEVDPEHYATSVRRLTEAASLFAGGSNEHQRKAPAAAPVADPVLAWPAGSNSGVVGERPV